MGNLNGLDGYNIINKNEYVYLCFYLFYTVLRICDVSGSVVRRRYKDRSWEIAVRREYGEGVLGGVGNKNNSRGIG